MTTISKPKKVSKELENAIYDDFKRKAVDDAKKRAVNQYADYETFKNMVSVAHLKPITAPSTKKQDIMLPSWQFNSDGTHNSGTTSQATTIPIPGTSTSSLTPPSSSGDFYREWRRMGSGAVDQKIAYLQLVGAERVRVLFKVEISPDTLKDIIMVLEQWWSTTHSTHSTPATSDCPETAAEAGQQPESRASAHDDAQFVVDVLHALSAAGRFSLTVKLLGSACKAVMQRLVTSVLSTLQSAQEVTSAADVQGVLDTIASIKTAYGVQ